LALCALATSSASIIADRVSAFGTFTAKVYCTGSGRWIQLFSSATWSISLLGV